LRLPVSSPLLYLIVFAALSLLLLVPCAVWAQSSPSPSAEEFEMGPGVTPAAEGRAGDTAVLAQFKEEYGAAREAQRPVFDVFEKYLPLVGATALLDILEEIYPACHGQAHDLGKALFAARQDLGAALRACGTRCTSGCMHGAVAAAFGGSTLAAITAQMNTFCEQGEMAQLHKPGNCAHALGHAFMFVTGGAVRQSVDACLGFANEVMQYYCATGVFMEKIITGPPSATPPPSWQYPCDEETLFPTACYRYKAIELLDRLGTATQLTRECLRLEVPQRRGCFHGLGHAMTAMVFTDPAQLAPLCRHGSQTDQIVCIEGAIEKLAEYDEERATTACASLDDDLRPVCEQAVTDKMYSLTKATFALYYDKDRVEQRRTVVATARSAVVAPSPHH
jgi:hypothetical protein